MLPVRWAPVDGRGSPVSQCTIRPGLTRSGPCLASAASPLLSSRSSNLKCLYFVTTSQNTSVWNVLLTHPSGKVLNNLQKAVRAIIYSRASFRSPPPHPVVLSTPYPCCGRSCNISTHEFTRFHCIVFCTHFWAQCWLRAGGAGCEPRRVSWAVQGPGAHTALPCTGLDLSFLGLSHGTAAKSKAQRGKRMVTYPVTMVSYSRAHFCFSFLTFLKSGHSLQSVDTFNVVVFLPCPKASTKWLVLWNYPSWTQGQALWPRNERLLHQHAASQGDVFSRPLVLLFLNPIHSGDSPRSSEWIDFVMKKEFLKD